MDNLTEYGQVVDIKGDIAHVKFMRTRITSYNVCYTKLLRSQLTGMAPKVAMLVITSYSIHYTKLYDIAMYGCYPSDEVCKDVELVV